ncbi:MAG TPA: WD40 repeat domain-containing protein [Cyanobacteria bacterium UBA8553]|nr:WD40 repeat domain-containing protein [Cyanobacteria bacterium UBA8553]
MTNNFHQPKAYDVVLGGQASAPAYGAVLGGLAGVKRRLSNSNSGNSLYIVEQRVNALKEALKYGSEGLALVIEALNDPFWQVQRTAYSLLQGYQEPTVIQALQEYNPYELFQGLYKYSKGTSTTYAIAITPDGQTMLSGGNDRIITVRHLGTGRILRTLTGHSGSIYALCLSHDGQILVSGGRDKILKVWNLYTASNHNSIPPTNRLIGDQLLHTLTGHSQSINCVAISPDRKMLVSGSEDNTIKLWDLPAGKLLHTLEGHEAGVKSVAISPDGQVLASGSADHTIKLWQLSKIDAPTHTLTGHSDWVKCLAITPDGQMLASGSQDKTIKLWQLDTGELKSTLIGHWGEVNCIAIAPDGQTLASCSWDETIGLWQLATGKQLYSLSGHQGAVAAVAISPDGHPLVSSSWDHTIRVWGLKNSGLTLS